MMDPGAGVGTVYIRPVGPVDEGIVRWLQSDIGAHLGTPVERMQPLEIPENSFDARRNQYTSTIILKAILAEAPQDGSKLLAVVDRDLCIPILTFVFGEAQLGGTAALVSLVRLRQEFYGLPPDPPLFFDRLHKEAVHELGHTFGLIHCRLPECVMYLSNTIRDVDTKGRTFCRACHESLESKTGDGRG